MEAVHRQVHEVHVAVFHTGEGVRDVRQVARAMLESRVGTM